MASKTKTTKFGIPKHVGPLNKSLLRNRITMISAVIAKGRALENGKPVGRKLSKKDLFGASLNLYTYRWQLKKIGAKKSSKKRAS